MKFLTKRKKLTAYALSCGYVHTGKRSDGLSVRLWHENGVYHATIFNDDVFTRVGASTLKSVREKIAKAIPEKRSQD